jgi:hypothetical protein
MPTQVAPPIPAIVDAATVVFCQDQYGPWTYYPNG